MLLNANESVAAIVKEAYTLSPLEQQILLTKLHVNQVRKKNKTDVLTPQKI